MVIKKEKTIEEEMNEVASQIGKACEEILRELGKECEIQVTLVKKGKVDLFTRTAIEK